MPPRTLWVLSLLLALGPSYRAASQGPAAAPGATVHPTAAPASAAAGEPPAAAAAGSSAEAPASAYNIELLVFRDLTTQGAPENWAIEAGMEPSVVSGEETAAGSQLGHFLSALPPAGFQLTDLENRLRASGAFVPVAHVGWTQTASAWGTRAGFPLERLGIQVPGLTGNVSLERGQYLHLGMSLSYAMTSPPQGLGAGPGTVFTLNESRRVRFYDRNYYDHPAFGVIALVTPAKGARPPGR